MKLSFIRKIKIWIMRRFRLIDHPVIRVYNGYGNAQHLIVFGHVLKLSPLGRKRYRRNFINNMFALLRLFIVKPFKTGSVSMEWDNVIYNTHIEYDGFFKFEIKPQTVLSPGWYRVKVFMSLPKFGNTVFEAFGEIYIPYPYQYAFISDIDDTFLISHSSNLRRRLFVLFSKNARSRQPFDGVVNHYQLLAANGADKDTYNPFFYVSSSEWNLYEYIVEFSIINKLPKGVYLLNQMKQFSQVFKTGQNNHKTKFMRIARIIEAYPEQRYILMGDDSQEDPNIYSAIVEHFPEKVYCIYLRHVHKSNQEKVKLIVKKIEEAGVLCCYFKHSAEAVIHSRQVGLITEI